MAEQVSCLLVRSCFRLACQEGCEGFPALLELGAQDLCLSNWCCRVQGWLLLSVELALITDLCEGIIFQGDNRVCLSFPPSLFPLSFCGNQVYDRLLVEDKEVHELLSAPVVKQFQNMRKVGGSQTCCFVVLYISGN